MTPQIGPRSGEIDIQRVAALAAPDDPDLGPDGFDGNVICATPSEIKRYLPPSDAANPAGALISETPSSSTARRPNSGNPTTKSGGLYA